MYCVYCGTKLNNDFVFCPNCGKKTVKIPDDTNQNNQISEDTTYQDDFDVQEPIDNNYEENEYQDEADEQGDDYDDIIYLTDENGNDIEYQLLDFIEYRDEEYVVLMQTKSDDGLVEIMRYEIDGENETYFQIDDDGLLQNIFEIFKSRAEGIFDFD